MAFISKFKWMVGVLVDLDAVRRISFENVEDVKNEGLDYVEFRFSPWFMAETHRLDPAGVVEAVVDGTTAGARDNGVKVNLIGILSRTYGPEIALKELDALLGQSQHLAAIDLAGDEVNFPPGMFTDHFHRARDAGLHITVHAGESAGPDSIWEAIRTLGAERIGHAIHAVHDPELVDYLVKYHIGIESCLTSNVQTSCVSDYGTHPLKFFLEHGVLASINTDDPGISAIDLPHEYDIAAPKAGLTVNQIRQAQMNALKTAFLSPTEKQALLAVKQEQPGK
jgi:adenosine deaminase